MSAFLRNLHLVSGSAKIVVNKDIELADGHLFKAGLHLTQDSIAALVRAVNPGRVEQCLSWEEPYTAFAFKADMLGFAEQHESLLDLYQPEVHDYWLMLGVRMLDQYPQLAFRLALLKHILPQDFEKTLFCLWFVVLDTHQTSRVEDDFCDLFSVALYHDLGMLDVDQVSELVRVREVSNKNPCESAAHVHYGAEFARSSASASERVIIAIAQHHERIDGTGFPLGLAGKQLAEFGMYIHLLDTAFELHRRHFLPLNKPLVDLLPIIEINAVTLFGHVASGLIALLRKCEPSKTLSYSGDELKVVQQQVAAMMTFLDTTIDEIQKFTNSVGFRHEDKRLFSLQNSFIHIALVHHKLHSDQDHLQLLVNAVDTFEGGKILEKQYFSLREIMNHIQLFCRQLEAYCTEHPDTPVSAKADRVIKKISAAAPSSIEFGLRE